MTVLPLDSPHLHLTSRSIPGPLRRILEAAELAGLPLSASELCLDTDSNSHARKVLISFAAARADVNLFILLSVALQRARPEAFGDRRPEGSERTAGVHEPGLSWWCPGRHGSGTRYAFSTRHLDFVEVIVVDSSRRVFIRVID